jgi:hypothetical protein
LFQTDGEPILDLPGRVGLIGPKELEQILPWRKHMAGSAAGEVRCYITLDP